MLRKQCSEGLPMGNNDQALLVVESFGDHSSKSQLEEHPSKDLSFGKKSKISDMKSTIQSPNTSAIYK